MEELKELIKRLEAEINETPTGKLRELLCDANILLQNKALNLPIVIDTEGELFAFSKFLLDCSYVRGKYYPETLVKLFKGK